MEAVLSLQPRDANAPVGQRPDDVVMVVAQDLVTRLPGGLKHRKVGHTFRSDSTPSHVLTYS